METPSLLKELVDNFGDKWEALDSLHVVNPRERITIAQCAMNKCFTLEFDTVKFKVTSIKRVIGLIDEYYDAYI